jgi:galactokinase
MMAAMLAGTGVIGARQAGAGFGGCMVALVEADAVNAFAAAVKSGYAARTGIEPHVYPVKPSAGAGLLDS